MSEQYFRVPVVSRYPTSAGMGLGRVNPTLTLIPDGGAYRLVAVVDYATPGERFMDVAVSVKDDDEPLPTCAVCFCPMHRTKGCAKCDRPLIPKHPTRCERCRGPLLRGECEWCIRLEGQVPSRFRCSVCGGGLLPHNGKCETCNPST